MTTVPLGVSAYNRQSAQEPEVQVLNRFLETNPTNQVEQLALLSRFGTSFFQQVGSAKLRKLFTIPGMFGGDLFIVSGTVLYRWDGENAPYAISGSIGGTGIPSMDASYGFGYQYLFIADGTSLQYYSGEGAARGTLTVTPLTPPDIANGDEIEVGGTYYQWTSGSVDAGTPAGTSSNPWLVAIGVDDESSLEAMFLAVNGDGSAGIDYSTSLTANLSVRAVQYTSTTLIIDALVVGTGGNSITISVITGSQIAWGGATLSGGGAHSLSGVPTPDDVGIVSVATLAGFVYCVVANSDRMYFIRPGEVTIDPLDFLTAESEPDELNEVLRVNDEMWAFGTTSTEVYYPSGDANLPAIRSQGRGFSQGVIAGTAVRGRTIPIVVAEDGIVYIIEGGPQRISTHGIEERIRRAINAEREAG